MSLLDKILRAGEGRQVRQLEKIAEEVNSFESKISALSDEELRNQTQKLKDDLAAGKTLDDPSLPRRGDRQLGPPAPDRAVNGAYVGDAERAQLRPERFTGDRTRSRRYGATLRYLP